MAERRVMVGAADGLHARPAALFVRAAAQCAVPVRIGKDGTGAEVDARSILAVLSLDVRHGDEVVLRADGPGAAGALDQLAALLAAADTDPNGTDLTGADSDPAGADA
jgi:phosphocarrier protein HPr